MAQLTYRDAVAAGDRAGDAARRDRRVPRRGRRRRRRRVQDDRRPARRVRPEARRDTPISEQAILGAAMGAAMTGPAPDRRDHVLATSSPSAGTSSSNQIAKTRYMTDGQVTLPLVIRTGNGGGAALRRAALAERRELGDGGPGPQGRRAVVSRRREGLMAAAVRERRPGAVLRAEGRSTRPRARCPTASTSIALGKAQGRARRAPTSRSSRSALMVPRALEAAEHARRSDGIDATVIDLRSLVPLDTQTILREVAKTGRLVTVEENPRLCGWGAEIASIVAEECSGTSTGRSCGSRRRTYRSRPRTTSRTSRFRTPTGSSPACVSSSTNCTSHTALKRRRWMY